MIQATARNRSKVFDLIGSFFESVRSAANSPRAVGLEDLGGRSSWASASGDNEVTKSGESSCKSCEWDLA